MSKMQILDSKQLLLIDNEHENSNMACCSHKYQFRSSSFSRPTANAQLSLKPKRMCLYGVLPKLNCTVPCISMSAASAVNGDRMVILSFEHA